MSLLDFSNFLNHTQTLNQSAPSYLNAINTAWTQSYELASQQNQNGEDVTALIDCIRCCLVVTGIQSITTHAPHDAEEQLWPMMVLSRHVSAEIKQKIVQYFQATLLTQLTAPSQVEAIQFILDNSTEADTENLKTLAIELLPQLSDNYLRASMMVSLAEHYADPRKENLLSDSLALVGEVADPWLKINLYMRHLSSMDVANKSDTIKAMFALIETIEEPYWRASTKSRLLRSLDLPQDQKDRLLEEIMALSTQITSIRPRLQAIIPIIHLLDEMRRAQLQDEILATIRTIESEYSRLGVLQYVAIGFDDDHKQAGLAIARQFTDGLFRTRAIGAFLPMITDQDRQTMRQGLLDYLNQIKDRTRDQALSLFARAELLSPEVWGASVTQDAVEAIIGMCNDWEIADYQ